MKKLLIIMSMVLALGMLCACEDKPAKKEEKTNTTTSSSIGSKIVEEAINAYNSSEEEKDEKSGEKEVENNDNSKRYANVEKNPVVTIEMQDGANIKVELYPQIAPTTVENFISLINKNFYDGVIFHRVIPSFMAQGGDPEGTGTGGPGYSIKGEFSENGFEQNDLKHDIGVISMARATDPNSAGSQFFIVTSDQSYLSLDGKYAGFGKVIEGMDEVYKIVNAKCEHTSEEGQEAYYKMLAGQEVSEIEEKLVYAMMGYDVGITLDRPIEPPTIKTMTVETFGVEYAEPEIIK